MQLQRAVSLPFDDPRWMSKLLPLLPLTWIIILPIFGLIPLALILGWLVLLIGNIRLGTPRPIPDWRDMSQKLILGADVLLVIILAHLPLLVVYGIAALLGGSIGSTFYSFIYNVGQLCCLIPLSLIYMLVMWVIIGMSVLDYSDSQKRADLYRPRYQWDRARVNASLMSGWLIRAVMVNVGCSLLMLVPVVGWVIAPLILWPTQGVLLGELGRLIDSRIGEKKKER